MSISRICEVVVGEHAHLRTVEAGDLVGLAVGADAALRERVLDLEEREGDAAHHEDDDERTDRLRRQLAEAELAERAAAEELRRCRRGCR